jgi:hypothetical protein
LGIWASIASEVLLQHETLCTIPAFNPDDKDRSGRPLAIALKINGEPINQPCYGSAALYLTRVSRLKLIMSVETANENVKASLDMSLI